MTPRTTLLHAQAISISQSPEMLEPVTRERNMNAGVRWLRISYWVGAIVDAVAAAQMLYPPLFAFGMRLTPFVPGDDYRYAMGMGASLMLGWTALLLWADRKPVERRGVLLLTSAVVAALAANEVQAVRAGFLPFAPVVAVWILQACLATLFLGSYALANRAAIADARSRPRAQLASSA
jgi:hypothetical protein